MVSRKTDLDFNLPPLVEVSFSLLFECVDGLHAGFLGLLWDEYREQYPMVQSGNEYEPQYEKFGVIERQPPTIRFIEKVPFPRLMFLSDDGQYVIQVQRDRFSFNWRNHHDRSLPYPKYKKVRELFIKEISKFIEFLKTNKLESVDVSQFEVTYVNNIKTELGSGKKVFKEFMGDFSHIEGLPELESSTVNLKYVIKDQKDKPIGRLYSNINNSSSDATVYDFRITARANPTVEIEVIKDNEDLLKIMETFDLLRNEINTCFIHTTHEEVQKEWE